MREYIYYKFDLDCITHPVYIKTDDKVVSELIEIVLAPYFIKGYDNISDEKNYIIINNLNNCSDQIIYKNVAFQCKYKSLWPVLVKMISKEISLKDGYCFMHSAIVERQNKAILLIGESGAGKSTLTAYLCSNGFHYICDDKVIIRVKDGYIYPFNRKILLRKDSIQLLKDNGVNFDIKELNLYTYHRYQMMNLQYSSIQFISLGIFINRVSDLQRDAFIESMDQNDIFYGILKNWYKTDEFKHMVNSTKKLAILKPFYKITYSDLDSCGKLLYMILNKAEEKK